MQVVRNNDLLRNYWWILLIRGICAILFGLAAVFWPNLTLLFFIYLFAAFAVVDGIVAIVAALAERRIFPYWWVVLLGGIVNIIMGIVVFSWPALTSLTLFYLIAIWAVLTGVLTIISAFSRYRSGQEWTLIVSGALSIVLGIIMAFHPVVSILAIVWLIGVFAIIYGIVLFVRAFQFRSLAVA